jgi:hypothetical protein
VRYSQDGKGAIKHCPGGTPLKGIVNMFRMLLLYILNW